MAISDADLEELSSMVMLLPRHACDKLRELVDLAARQLASVDELATLRAQRDELKKDRDMWRAECESLSRELGLPPTMRPAEGELARFYALALTQRDEARELVRRYVDAEMDPTDEDGDGRRGSFKASRSAVARWDEEEKKR